MTLPSAAVLAEFSRESECPVDWTTEIGWPVGSDRARNILDLEWVRAVERCAVDPSEASFVEQVQLFGSPLLGRCDELIVATENLKLRRDRAVANYIASFGRFAGLTFVSPSEHNAGKHFRPGKQLQDLPALTRVRTH